MTHDQLRQVLKELNGERHAHFTLAGMHEKASTFTVASAMLIPQETDGLVKVTDGKSVYVIDAERIAYIRIEL